MKKFILLCTVIFSGITVSSNAATITIHVKNFAFSPKTVNAVVGDVIQFVWDNGSHTTTSKTIPVGAAAWDAIMDGTATHTTFNYILTVAGTYNYKCTPHELGGMIGTLTVTGALPVVLSYLNINSTAGNKALLTWKTVTEQNTASFIVKRSIDGDNFTEIGRVNAAGNSNTEKSYNYTDNSIGTANNYYYYMLEIADKDNRRTLSDIKLFKNNAAVRKLILSLSPNPITSPGHLMLQFNADKAGSMHVQLFNTAGRLIKETDMGADEGINNGHFHLGNLPAGVYKILFTLDDLKETKTIVVQ
ncbi:MAG TPA: plastocyanin/azurin family copper-binding protein [Panacibacter sp.]|nr:plastocyanin/azurin family copper-binding protein [Panacibacter sp.]